MNRNFNPFIPRRAADTINFKAVEERKKKVMHSMRVVGGDCTPCKLKPQPLELKTKGWAFCITDYSTNSNSDYHVLNQVLRYKIV